MNPPRSPSPVIPQVYDPNPVFDATLFGDPLATQVCWWTMAEYQTEFQTHSFHQDSPHHIELRPTVHALTNGLLSLALGSLIGGWAIGSSLLAGELEFLLWIACPASSLFVFFGVKLIRRYSIRHMFDLREGAWWMGTIPPSQNPGLFTKGKAAPTSAIHALQLLGDPCDPHWGGGSDRGEINLVFQDGTRRHLAFFHKQGLHDAANRIATLLDVPVWNYFAAMRPEDPAIDHTP